MRIALVHSFYGSAQPSGENSVVLDQAQALRDAGHDVELVGRETDVVQSEPLYAVRSALTVATGRGPDPSDQFAAFRPDVVHVHNTFPNWGTAPLRAWASRTVATVHNFRPLCAAATLFRDGAPCQECLRTPVLPAIRHACYRDSRLASVPVALGTRPRGPMRTLLADAAAVTVLNEQARELYTRILRRPVELVPNFVDDTGDGGQYPRRGWVYVGRFTEEKGIVDLVRHWPHGEHLDVIGAGPAGAQVHAAAADRPDVTVMAPLDRTELRRRLAHYEGLVLPSLWAEGLPTVVLEALAAGTPSVVSLNVSAGASLRDLGVAGIYDPTLGEREISRALGTLRGRGDAMSLRARTVHRNLYSRDVWLSAITAIYERVARA